MGCGSSSRRGSETRSGHYYPSIESPTVRAASKKRRGTKILYTTGGHRPHCLGKAPAIRFRAENGRLEEPFSTMVTRGI
ncbi:hypothetical protein DIPPA_26971 [Diplonema papillatum]|nr:hypothetical protein DIPPA_26971 [Diplonema papillatum]